VTRLAAVASLGALLLAAGAAGGKTSPPTSFVFGRAGGNVVPSRTTISSSGRVTVDGRAGRSILPAAVSGLATLAKAEGFWSLPRTIKCPGQLPDFASLYVGVHSGGRSKTVTVRGSCNSSFAELYAVLVAVAGPGRA
jgi:hypothetical protein